MHPEDVGRSYDLLAEHWNSDRFPRQNGIEPHERALAFTDHRGPALDIGCGSSGRILDLLLAQGFEPEGLDVSGKMLELARRRHPDLTFHHADICEWTFPRSYDFISAWDSIWHVPLEHQQSVLRRILASLSPGGVVIFTMGGLDGPSEIEDSHMGPPMYHATLGIPQTVVLIGEAGAVCRHLEYDQYPEQHVYVIAQRLEDRGRAGSP